MGYAIYKKGSNKYKTLKYIDDIEDHFNCSFLEVVGLVEKNGYYVTDNHDELLRLLRLLIFETSFGSASSGLAYFYGAVSVLGDQFRVVNTNGITIHDERAIRRCVNSFLVGQKHVPVRIGEDKIKLNVDIRIFFDDEKFIKLLLLDSEQSEYLKCWKSDTTFAVGVAKNPISKEARSNFIEKLLEEFDL